MIYSLKDGFFFFFDGLPKQLSFAKMKAANLLEVWKDMGCALSLKNLSWLSYLDHQAINAKDFEFLSQLLMRNQRGSCGFWLLCGFGFEAIIDP